MLDTYQEINCKNVTETKINTRKLGEKANINITDNLYIIVNKSKLNKWLAALKGKVVVNLTLCS